MTTQIKHPLKTWPEFFQAVAEGKKTFEVRKNDRHFETGDILHLIEYDPTMDEKTGKAIDCRVTYILNGGWMGIEEGYVVMGIEKIGKS